MVRDIVQQMQKGYVDGNKTKFTFPRRSIQRSTFYLIIACSIMHED